MLLKVFVLMLHCEHEQTSRDGVLVVSCVLKIQDLL